MANPFCKVPWAQSGEQKDKVLSEQVGLQGSLHCKASWTLSHAALNSES